MMSYFYTISYGIQQDPAVLSQESSKQPVQGCEDLASSTAMGERKS